MSAGFKVGDEVFWGTNGGVEEYVRALADQAAARFGPDHPLAASFRNQRDAFTDYGREWVATVIAQLRARIAGETSA